jgi:hypothetical protein
VPSQISAVRAVVRDRSLRGSIGLGAGAGTRRYSDLVSRLMK